MPNASQLTETGAGRLLIAFSITSRGGRAVNFTIFSDYRLTNRSAVPPYDRLVGHVAIERLTAVTCADGFRDDHPTPQQSLASLVRRPRRPLSRHSTSAVPYSGPPAGR
jgi:hypothetical protein